MHAEEHFIVFLGKRNYVEISILGVVSRDILLVLQQGGCDRFRLRELPDTKALQFSRSTAKTARPSIVLSGPAT